LDEDLMRRALGEAHDLVLDRRAVARADPFDPPAIERRAVEAGANDLVRALGRMSDMAQDLARMHRARAAEREDGHGVVARLLREAFEVDRLPVDARRRAGLEPADRKAPGPPP